MIKKVENYFTKTTVSLPVVDDGFVSPDVKYYFDALVTNKQGEVKKVHYFALNDKKRERILSRFIKRAIKCRRFTPINPISADIEK